jgi:hypothetical protein
MTKIAFPLTVFAAVLLCAVRADPAQAQRLFVSATGLDGNPCTFASPCRTFQHAHDVIAASGEIDVLDPAGYGPLTITKAISIQGHGFSGVSVPSGGVGITINAPSTDAVHLNGLLIEGGHVGQNGIVFNSGQSLTVENCIVRNLSANGLLFFALTAAAANLAVSNSYFNDNFDGIVIETRGSGNIKASVDRTGLYGNDAAGLDVEGSFGTGAIDVAVTDSVAANNDTVGFFVESATSHSVTHLSLTHTLAEADRNGVEAFGTNATLWIARSTVTGNTLHGFNAGSGGVINSFGDNYFAVNGANGGSLTNVSAQ